MAERAGEFAGDISEGLSNLANRNTTNELGQATAQCLFKRVSPGQSYLVGGQLPQPHLISQCVFLQVNQMIFGDFCFVHVVIDVVTHATDVVVEQFFTFRITQLVWYNVFGLFKVLMPELD